MATEERIQPDSRSSEPAWPFLVAGYLFGAAVIGVPSRIERPATCDVRVPDTARDTAAPDTARYIDRWSPRELRRLPGIGQARALAIARTRFDEDLHGGVDAHARVPGIGPETARRVRAWLAEHTERPAEAEMH